MILKQLRFVSILHSNSIWNTFLLIQSDSCTIMDPKWTKNDQKWQFFRVYQNNWKSGQQRKKSLISFSPYCIFKSISRLPRFSLLHFLLHLIELKNLFGMWFCWIFDFGKWANSQKASLVNSRSKAKEFSKLTTSLARQRR